MKKGKKILIGILELFTLISFIYLTLFIGDKHEPWADEAQAWLLARDTTIPELLQNYMGYEGSPALWHLILKAFIAIGWKYEYYYVIPILFSAIGVAILEFKTKIPLIFKITIPFTYYIFYQYSIVARSYCLLFPTLMYLATIYNKKTEKPILFGIGIAILLSISAHTCILAATISFIYGLQVLKLTYNYIKKKDSIRLKLLIKNWIIIFVLFSLFLVTAYYVRTPADHVEFRNIEYRQWKYFITILSDSLITNDKDILMCLGVSIIAVIILFVGYFKDKRFFEAILLILPVYLFLAVFYCNKWHIGIIFEIILFILIVHNKLKEDILIQIIFLLVLAVQIIYSVNTSLYDLTRQYSACEDIVSFINNNSYQDKSIYGIGYSATAIEPYFEKNIFANKKNNKGFYSWREDEPEYMSIEEMKDNLPEILIISSFSSSSYASLINRVETGKLYEKYYFEGATYVKDEVYENEGFYVYVSINLLSANKDFQNSEVVILNR